VGTRLEVGWRCEALAVGNIDVKNDVEPSQAWAVNGHLHTGTFNA
jgi:hypothetical protein